MNDWAFYFITDEALTEQGAVKDVQDAIKGGAKVVQYRNKNGETLELFKEAKEIRKITKDAGVDLRSAALHRSARRSIEGKRRTG